MSHALKKAAVVPTHSVKHEARFNGRKNKEHLLGFFKIKKIKNLVKIKLLKKTFVFRSCHRHSDINAVIFGLNIINCAPTIAFCMCDMS